MAKTILISDETHCGKVLNQVMLSFEEDSITLSQLIKKRIQGEVDAASPKMPLPNKPIFQRQANRQDAHIALHAFRENGFFILINNKQIKDLDHEIMLNNALSVRFVALHPRAM